MNDILLTYLVGLTTHIHAAGALYLMFAVCAVCVCGAAYKESVAARIILRWVLLGCTIIGATMLLVPSHETATDMAHEYRMQRDAS